MRKILVSGACVVASVVMAATPASAIKCEGNFQLQRNGEKVATPYCEDKYLAQLARAHGMEVNARTIRINPEAKETACQLAADDIGALSTCAPFNNSVNISDGGGAL
jgi:hypothetical protein